MPRQIVLHSHAGMVHGRDWALVRDYPLANDLTPCLHAEHDVSGWSLPYAVTLTTSQGESITVCYLCIAALIGKYGSPDDISSNPLQL